MDVRLLRDHVGSGKLNPADIPGVVRIDVPGGKLRREIAEQLKIEEFGGIKGGKVSNQRNPIGPKRRHVMK